MSASTPPRRRSRAATAPPIPTVLIAVAGYEDVVIGPLGFVRAAVVDGRITVEPVHRRDVSAVTSHPQPTPTDVRIGPAAHGKIMIVRHWVTGEVRGCRLCRSCGPLVDDDENPFQVFCIVDAPPSALGCTRFPETAEEQDAALAAAEFYESPE